MTFTPDQWLILLLTFVLGLVLGAAILANPKWKSRYREEVARRQELEAENERLTREYEVVEDRRNRREAAEMDSLRHAAARDEARHRSDEPGPL